MNHLRLKGSIRISFSCLKCSVSIPWCCSSPLSGHFLHKSPLAGCRTRWPAASTRSRRRAAWTEALPLRRTKPRRGAPSASLQETWLGLLVFLFRLSCFYSSKSALAIFHSVVAFNSISRSNTYLLTGWIVYPCVHYSCAARKKWPPWQASLWTAPSLRTNQVHEVVQWK